MKKIPCEGCICFPICRVQAKEGRPILSISRKCKLLYNYIFSSHSLSLGHSLGYTPHLCNIRRMMLE